MALQVVDTKNKKVSDVALAEGASEKVNKAVLYYAVKAARNNLRRGTAKVKDRSEINKTNKKIYRQKGTGSARHGARRANIFVGGGSAFGPKPRSFNEKINKKFKKSSIQETFKYIIQNDGLKILDKLEFSKPSSKEAAGVLKNLGITQALVIVNQENKNAQMSFRNLKDVKVVNDNNLNLYDMLRYENVVLSAQVFEQYKERYSL